MRMSEPDHIWAGHILRNMTNLFPGATEKRRQIYFGLSFVALLALGVLTAAYIFDSPRIESK